MFVGATDGMRMLAVSNSSAADAILSTIRDRIQNDFTFQQENLTEEVRVLLGYEQALHTWLGVNYASDRFVRAYPRGGVVPGLPPSSSAIQWPPPVPAGILSLNNICVEAAYGVSFDNLNKTHVTNTRIFGQDYAVYSHGLLCYGYVEAERRFLATLVAQLPAGTNTTIRQVENPCAPLNYSRTISFLDLDGPTQFCTLNIKIVQAYAASYEFVGTSNVSECEANMTNFFDMPVPCVDGSRSTAPVKHCSLKTMWKPAILSDTNFTALSGYYDTMLFFNFNLSTGAGGHTKIVAGMSQKLPESFVVNRSSFAKQVKAFCALNWLQVQSFNPHTPGGTGQNLASNCFQAQLVLRLLDDGYGLDSDREWDRITFVRNTLPSTEADGFDWPLGYALLVSNSVPAKLPNYVMPVGVFVCLIVLFSVCVLVAAGFAVKARREQLRTAEYERFPTPDEADVI